AGYPGRTSRYKLPVEIVAARDTILPRTVAEIKADLAVIDAATKSKPEWEVRYASVEKSLRNGMKKSEGLVDGFAVKDIAAIKEQQFVELKAWSLKQKNAAENAQVFAELDKLVAEDLALGSEQFAAGLAFNSDLLKSASTLYRLSVEKKKKDEDREPGYQERDLAFIKARLTRLEQAFVKDVDLQRYKASLRRYIALAAAQHPKGLDSLLPKEADLDKIYADTALDQTAHRLKSMDESQETLDASKDPFIKLAALLHPVRMELETRRKDIDGRLDRVIPRYMAAVIAWKKSQGKPVYPDANSTLRVTFGTVASFSPVDGIIKGPFTTVEGIAAKTTQKKPFESSKELLDAIRNKRYGAYKDKVLGTVPVNFLSSVDTTGGNSGSAVVNKKGDLVGLNFDSTYESVTKDWYFDDERTRAIHVDIRYMLWVMKEIDKADNVLSEMTIR
ncbi:MAG: S46 family peptidase, partial [Proteobacteria bacterium]